MDDPSDDIGWDDWRLFLAACQAGSLSGAAAALGLAQATLSRRIANLEQALGQLLFDRTRTGLEPTAAARALIVHAEAMAAAAQAARATCEGFEVEPAGLVRIAATEGFGVDLAPLVLPRLASRFPQVRLEVLADVSLADLSTREADLAVRNVRPEGGDLLIRRLPDLPIAVYAAPALVDALPAGAALADLPFVTLSDSVGGRYTQAMSALFGGRPAAFTANRWLVVRAAAQAGAGVMITSASEARTLGLVPVPVEAPPMPPAAWYLVVPRPLRTVPRIAAVIGLVEEVLAEWAA